ncbi:hypothetical protein C8Q74DRAFT_1213305 [Fomes fomentarius]|nr:hypothetical protein C8Q74DRAFT_1213305 [Fomes fomentarius]
MYNTIESSCGARLLFAAGLGPQCHEDRWRSGTVTGHRAPSGPTYATGAEVERGPAGKLSEEADGNPNEGFWRGKFPPEGLSGVLSSDSRNGPGHRSGGRGWLNGHLTFHLKRREREREGLFWRTNGWDAEAGVHIARPARPCTRPIDMSSAHARPLRRPLPLSHQPAVPTICDKWAGCSASAVEKAERGRQWSCPDSERCAVWYSRGRGLG